MGRCLHHSMAVRPLVRRTDGPPSAERIAYTACMSDETILDKQLAYYRARASEYDEWHRREGRYDRGDEHRRQWLAELDDARESLNRLRPFGRVLELACGTGLWTGELAAGADHVTAIDAAPETIEINRTKLANPRVRYVLADLFEWRPEECYDLIFFGFWLSHVPAERFERFWSTVCEALAPGGRVFFVDSLKTQQSTATNHAALTEAGTVERVLNDGRAFRIVKVFYDPERLTACLAARGWDAHIETTGSFFLYGTATRAPAADS